MTSGDVDDAGYVRAAARNNAELCGLVCRGHGVEGSFAVDAWTCARRTPDLYPDAVTLDPAADHSELLARIDPSVGASVKDSFAVMDLAPASFRVLFTAEWIFRAAGVGVVAASPLAWARVVDADGLRVWESVWGERPGTFHPAVLDELVVLRGEVDGAVVAGAVLNRSELVVGVSNFFASAVDPVLAWAGLLGEIGARFPGLGIVGYESGPALEVARRAGFRSIGPLRVWIHD